MVDRRRQWRAENQDISITEQLSRQAYLVNGTQGTEYIVTLDDPSCRCPDWQKRSPTGGCKHILKVKLEEGLIDPLPSARTDYGASSDVPRGGYSDDWEALSLRTRKRDNWKCQCCGVKGGPEGDAQLNAHHIVPKSKGGADAADNLISLCVDCHEEEHGHRIPSPDSTGSGSRSSATRGSRRGAAGTTESGGETNIDEYVSEMDPQAGLWPRDWLQPPEPASPSQKAPPDRSDVSLADVERSTEAVDSEPDDEYQEEDAQEVPQDEIEGDSDGAGNPLDLVNTIGDLDQPTAHTLWEAGFRTPDAIAAASLDELAVALGGEPAIASRIKNSASDEPESEGDGRLDSSPTERATHDTRPAAGHENTGAESTEETQSEADTREVQQPPIPELVDDAEGNIREEHLTESRTNRPLGAHLRPDEQPHYCFNNVRTGLRFTHPDWDSKKMPYNLKWLDSDQNTRYFLITDRRFLFVGGHPEGTDTVDSFCYTDLTGVDSNRGWTKARLTMKHEDGRSITFFNRKEIRYVEEAGEYVAKRIRQVEG